MATTPVLYCTVRFHFTYRELAEKHCEHKCESIVARK